MARMPGVPFLAPRSWTSGRPAGPPRLIVIHYTAGSEGPTAAADGISYDQRRTDGTSAHFYTDRGQIIQCVDTADRAHTALWNGNLYGIHIEQCGTVQTREQWLDPVSRETIRNTARVCAWAIREHGIPLVRLVDRQVRTGTGLCGHGDITRGFPEDGGTHTDPGTAYPWDVLFADISEFLDPEDDMDPNTLIEVPSGINIPGLAVGSKVKAGWLWLANYQHTLAVEQADRVNAAADATRDAALAALVQKVVSASGGTGSVDTAAVVTAIRDEADKTRIAIVQAARTDLAGLADALGRASTNG